MGTPKDGGSVGTKKKYRPEVTLGCNDISLVAALPACCLSCHEDQGYYNGMLEDNELPWKHIYQVDVCCFVSTALDALLYKERLEIYDSAFHVWARRYA